MSPRGRSLTSTGASIMIFFMLKHTLKFRLEKFQPIDFSKILPTNAGSELSSLWRVSIEESKLLNKSDD